MAAMEESSSRSFGRTVLAALILVVAAWILLKIVIGIVALYFLFRWLGGFKKRAEAAA